MYTRTFPLKQISSKGGKTQSESDKGAPGRPFCVRERERGENCGRSGDCLLADGII